MSDTGNNPARIPGEPTAARSGRNPPKSGCVTALLILAGGVLLLPGLCTLFFSGSNGGGFSHPPFFTIKQNVGFPPPAADRALLTGNAPPRRSSGSSHFPRHT